MLFVPRDLKLRVQAEDTHVVPSADEIESILNASGLRPTRQRMALGILLFRGEHRHVTADGLHQEALDAGVSLSLATVYNTLDLFADALLLRRFTVDGTRTYFDTDAGDHHHFYVEAEDRIIDIPRGSICLDHLPVPPVGYEITKADMVIRLKLIQPGQRSGSLPSMMRRCLSSRPSSILLRRPPPSPTAANQGADLGRFELRFQTLGLRHKRWFAFETPPRNSITRHSANLEVKPVCARADRCGKPKLVLTLITSAT